MDDHDRIIEENRKSLEKRLGGPVKFSFEEGITGIEKNSIEEIIYFECTKKPSIGFQFDKFFKSENGVDIKGGGCILGVCTLTLPSGKMFRDMSYNGDIPGWRRAIEVNATMRGIRLAKIADEKLVISDGEVVALSDCSARFGSK